MSIENLSDHSLLKFYENIRQQVSADIQRGSRHRFMGETAKREAERLYAEIERRGLRARVKPIVWQ